MSIRRAFGPAGEHLLQHYNDVIKRDPQHGEGDENGDFPETWGFLDRRINDVLKAFGMPRRIKERLGRLFPPVNPFRRRSV